MAYRIINISGLHRCIVLLQFGRESGGFYREVVLAPAPVTQPSSMDHQSSPRLAPKFTFNFINNFDR